MKNIYTLKNNVEEMDETRSEYNKDLNDLGLYECILNNDKFSNTFDSLEGIDKLTDKQINIILNSTLAVFKDSFKVLTETNIFEFDTFVSYQTLICNLIIENIKKAIDNI